MKTIVWSVLPLSLALLLGLAALATPSAEAARFIPPLEKKPPHLENPVPPLKPPKWPPAAASTHDVPVREKKPPIALQPVKGPLVPRPPLESHELRPLHAETESLPSDSYKPPAQKPTVPPHGPPNSNHA